MYEVRFMEVEDGDWFVFLSDIPTASLALRIADNLMDEGFVFNAWPERQ